MEINYTQTIYVLIFYVLTYVLAKKYTPKKIKKKLRKHKLAIVIAGVLFLVFAANPLKKTVPSITSVGLTPEFVVTGKVQVSGETYTEKQEAELEQLRKDNKEKQNEIDNEN